jgi:hypothetical protein
MENACVSFNAPLDHVDLILFRNFGQAHVHSAAKPWIRCSYMAAVTSLVEGSDVDLGMDPCVHVLYTFFWCFLVIIVTLNQIIGICCCTLYAF